MDSAEREDAERPNAAYTDFASDGSLLDACFDVFRCFDLEAQLDRLLVIGREWTSASFGVAFGPAPETDVFTPLVVHPSDEEEEEPSVTAVDGGRLRRWSGNVLRLVEGTGPFEEVVRRWPGGVPATTLVLPLAGDRGPLAVVLLLAFDRPPPAAAVERFGRLVDHVKPALHNGLRVLSMRELVIKDDTAECFNRRYFETTLPAELSRASRYHSPLSLIFLDMDNLKEVNNRHGHAMGSRTLLEVSQRIRSRVRRFDKLFRFGGDEFCIVLPETEWHGALEVAERVRDAIASRQFLTRELGDANGIRMTASLGIASYPLHARTQKDLIEHADRAMQRIKNATKNSIGIAEIVGGSHGS